MLPFYIFYSMFGLQRTGDQAWAFGDMRGRGFLMGATAGRTTLNGEGLQHQDGHSHLFANAIPNLIAYDPAYAYEMAVIIRDGLRRMLEQNEDIFYYLTLYNENYLMPPMPDGAEEGILRGIYKLKAGPGGKHRAQLFGSGTLLHCALRAQEILAERYDVSADVWSVTSYQQLFREGRKAERHARLHPHEPAILPHVTRMLEGESGPVVAVSDWVQELPSLVGRFIPNRFVTLGTNGYGRSDTRKELRFYFEVSPSWIVVATLHALMLDGHISPELVSQATRDMDLDPEKADPMYA
jgi:pyruvate dehydrogenase E1 component